MRKTKLSVLFAAVLTMLGFTSCLNGDDNSTFQGALILKYVSGYLGGGHFEDMAGTKYNPDKMVTNSNGSEFAIVPMQYDTQLYNQEKNSYDITLMGDPSFFPKGFINPQDVPSDAVTASFKVLDDMYVAQGAIWGYENDYLLIPVSYCLDKSVDVTDKTALKAELSKHKINVYSPSGKNTSMAGDSLKLYVHYTIDGVNESDEESIKEFEGKYTNVYSEWRYYPLKPLLSGMDLSKLKYIRVEYDACRDFGVKATIDPEKKKKEFTSYRLYEKK